ASQFPSHQKFDKAIPSSSVWQNLAELERISIQNVSKEQKELLRQSDIPPSLWPYVNITAVEQRERKRKTSSNDVNRDENDADMLDDNQVLPNTVQNDGKKIVITITEEAGRKLLQHWADQALSGIMAAVANNKLKSIGYTEKIAHKKCNKGATSVVAHAKCVVALLDAETKYRRWSRRFGKSGNRGERIKALRAKLAKLSRTNRGEQEFLGRKLLRRILQKQGGKWIGSFKVRTKRSVSKQNSMQVKSITRDKYDLIEERVESPLGMVAERMLRAMRRLKNKKVDDFRS
ncbi:unnamed protein product, partial [Cylicostephanus goldi]